MKVMYRLELVTEGESFQFMKFVANFFYLFFEEGKNSHHYEIASLIDTLKVQLDLHREGEHIQLQMDGQVLIVMAQLVDWLAKKNLEENEAVHSLAMRTEQMCRTRVWHIYLRLAHSFFEHLKQFLRPEEWLRIETALGNDEEGAYGKVA
jgi:hypothetical protein